MKKLLTLSIIFVVILSSFVASSPKVKASSSPATIKVPQDYPTIQGAINAANPGDVVLVASGTYYENVIINKAVSLIGESRDTAIIDGGKTGHVVYVTGSEVVVSGFTIRNSGFVYYPEDCGIYLLHSSGNFILDNIITNNRLGFKLEYSDNNIIRDNTIINNRDGIWLYSSHNNTMQSNIIINNEWTPIWLYESTNNMMQHNSIRNSLYGIYLYRSSNNVMQSNTIADCNYGILLYWGVHDNNFYHNSFINNLIQVSVYFYGIPNTWDDGYPSGGNYWSDYTGVDDNGDGIGDTPYTIDDYNQDRYPLMSPFIGDFEISVSPSSQIADPNEPSSYTVTVTSLDGFSSPVSLRGMVDGDDLSLSFDPQVVIAPSDDSAYSILTVSIVSTALATHTIIITGTGEEIVHSKIIILNVPFLSVPYYSQGDTTWCAVSSVAMIMKFYGIYVHPWDVAQGLLQGHNTPTHVLLGDPWKIVVYLIGAGLSPELDIVDLAKIKEKLDNKEPVVLAVMALHHAVAITGYLDIDSNTVLFVNDPSGVLVDKLYLGEYSPPYVQNRVEWNDLEPYIGLGDWIIGVGGNAKPPMGTINVVGGGDYLDTWDHSIIVNHPPDHPGSDVYIWMSGYVLPGSSDTPGLTWKNAPTHPKSLDPEDLFSINIESEGAEWHRVVVNPTGTARTYSFEIVFSREGQVKWEKEYNVTVPALNWSDPIPSHIGLGDILNESGTYTIEFFLSSPDGSTLYDKVELPPIEYTEVLSLSCESPVNLYVMDPEGNAIGVDPETDETVNEILDAVYSGPGTEPQIIRIPNPLDGDYVILMVGTATGTYLATLELTTLQETITQTYSGSLEESEVLESLAIVFENDMTSTPPLSAISVNKIFKPNEVSTKRKGAVMSRTNIKNTGYLNIDEITYEDQILDGWTLKDFDHTISVTLFIDNVKYKIPYEELTFVTTEDNTYVVYINFTDGVDLYQYDPEPEQEAYVMTIYAFETGWVLEIKYPMLPPRDLLAGDYEATVSTTIATPEGISLTIGDSATLHIS